MTAAGPGTAVAVYQLDRGVSRFTVRAFATGMLSAMGHSPTIAIRNFAGEASLDAGDLASASLNIRIRVDSLEVTDEISSKDRREMETAMNQKVLESGKYPEITFASTAASAEPLGDGRYKIAMHGNLSLHGVTQRLPVTAHVSLTGDMLRANGEFSILQSNYGIAPVSVAGGALKLKDELKFAFDIVARKQE